MRFGIVGNEFKKNVSGILSDLVAFLKSEDIPFMIDKELLGNLNTSANRKYLARRSDLLKNSDVIISLGGDGTFLNTARIVGKRNIPILGVNMGNLGFMAEVVPTEMKGFIKKILKGQYRISEREIISATAGNGKKLNGLNDIVIDREKSIRMLEIEVCYNGEFVVGFVADGVIISTPTGSTGYSLSAGGPIITQGSKVFIVTPICAHTLNVRPMIFPYDGEIVINVKKEIDVRITADGQASTSIKAPTKVILGKAEHTIKVIKKVRSNYFKTLNEKLLWGKDMRKY